MLNKNRRELLKKVLASACIFSFPQLSWSQQISPSVIIGRFGNIPNAESIHHIVSAGPVADVFLLSLSPEKLLGFSQPIINKNREKYFSEIVKSLPHTGRLAGKGSTFPIEKLLALKPDIIVDVGSTTNVYLSTAKQVAEQTGIPYILMNGALQETPQQLKELGNLLGVPERGAQLADQAQWIFQLIDQIRQQLITQGRPPLKIYFPRGVDGLETGLPGSIHTESIELLGAYNVATPIGTNKIVRISMEQLIQWDPDVIVSQDETFYQQVKANQLWQHLSAVKTGHLYLAPTQPFGWLDYPPSLNRLLGLPWFARVLYPDLISYERYAKETMTYFQLFYHYNLTENELLTLSEGLK